MTQFGIHRLVTHYAKLVVSSSPSLIGKRVSPSHDPPHNCGAPAEGRRRHRHHTGLVRHVSLDTTNIHAEVDMEMKARALASVDISDELLPPGRCKALPALMTFLERAVGHRLQPNLWMPRAKKTL